ncbi:hypothetical protein FKM82_030148 [Ascaphus truei]
MSARDEFFCVLFIVLLSPAGWNFRTSFTSGWASNSCRSPSRAYGTGGLTIEFGGPPPQKITPAPPRSCDNVHLLLCVCVSG